MALRQADRERRLWAARHLEPVAAQAEPVTSVIAWTVRDLASSAPIGQRGGRGDHAPRRRAVGSSPSSGADAACSRSPGQGWSVAAGQVPPRRDPAGRHGHVSMRAFRRMARCWRGGADRLRTIASSRNEDGGAHAWAHRQPSGGGLSGPAGTARTGSPGRLGPGALRIPRASPGERRPRAAAPQSRRMMPWPTNPARVHGAPRGRGPAGPGKGARLAGARDHRDPHPPARRARAGGAVRAGRGQRAAAARQPVRHGRAGRLGHEPRARAAARARASCSPSSSSRSRPAAGARRSRWCRS